MEKNTNRNIVPLPYFFPEVQKLADGMSANKGVEFEFIFVNDGSKDRTLELLREFAAEECGERNFPGTLGKRRLSTQECSMPKVTIWY